jgi:phytoene dehydrogenase-like protein
VEARQQRGNGRTRPRGARVAGGRSDAAVDAIVIGAGHNGLVAANLLADAGWDVLVLEATGEIGGAARSAQITAPGFLSDRFSAFYPLAAASPVISSLHLEDYGLRWRHAPHVLAHVLPDGRSVTMSRDVEATAASVAEFAAGDAAAWRELVGQWSEVQDLVLEALFRPFPPITPMLRLSRRIKAAGMARFARMVLLSARRFGDEWFAGDGAKLLVAGCAMHADISVDSAGSAAFGWLMAMVGQRFGFPVPQGGSGMLPAALAARLRSRGGVVRTGEAVERVVVRGRRAVGVVTAGGETLRARRGVLADVNAPALYHDLVGDEHLPDRFVKDLRLFQWDPSTVKLDWALSEPVPWRSPDVRGAGTVHLDVDMNGLTSYAAAINRGEIPEHPFVLFGQMTTSDPSRSPDGTESAWAYTHVPNLPTLPSRGLAATAERVEEIVERHAPGFRDLIVGRSVQWPADLEAHNPSLRRGAINGGTAQLHQEAIFRPTVGLGGAATPIDRLFLAGSSAHPGGGVHGGPGANAARAALARSGVSGWATRRATAAAMSRLYRETPARPTRSGQ